MNQTIATAASAGAQLSIPSAFGYSVLGFSIVFFVLVVLMFVIKAIRGVVEQMAANQAAAAPASAPRPAAAAPAVAAAVPAAPTVKYDVEDKTAALIIAIVADALQTPLNQLRFITIREKR